MHSKIAYVEPMTLCAKTEPASPSLCRTLLPQYEPARLVGLPAVLLQSYMPTNYKPGGGIMDDPGKVVVKGRRTGTRL